MVTVRYKKLNDNYESLKIYVTKDLRVDFFGLLIWVNRLPLGFI